MQPDSEPLSPNAILRFPEARKRGLIPYSKSQWYHLMRQRDENNEPLAPLPIPLAGGGAVGWLVADLYAWVARQAGRRGERIRGPLVRAPDAAQRANQTLKAPGIRSPPKEAPKKSRLRGDVT